MMGLSGKCPGKKLSFIVTFFMATAETPGLCSITLSTRRNGNLNKENGFRKIKQNRKTRSKDAFVTQKTEN